MKPTYLKAVAFLLLLGASWAQAATTTAQEKTYQAQANLIRTNFDENFIRLSSGAQNHYAPRMYRLTGERYYAELSGREIFQIHDRLNHYLPNINKAEWRQVQAQQMIDKISPTPRGKLRKEVLAGTGDKRFALYLLYQLAKLDEYGLTHPGHAEFVSYLKRAKLDELLFEPEFIHAYAAQVANYVYWLKQLEIYDWRPQLKPAFAKAFNDKDDHKLSKREFNNKLYGLTHIVLADSLYYQKFVDAKEHQWILDYFANNLERISTKSKSDIHAEIGLCYLLAKEHDSPVLAKMKALISDAIDPQKQMVLSVSGSDNLSSGEHRNVLSYALLHWPETLHQGPMPLQDKKLKAGLPLVYQQ